MKHSWRSSAATERVWEHHPTDVRQYAWTFIKLLLLIVLVSALVGATVLGVVGVVLHWAKSQSAL